MFPKVRGEMSFGTTDPKRVREQDAMASMNLDLSREILGNLDDRQTLVSVRVAHRECVPACGWICLAFNFPLTKNAKAIFREQFYRANFVLVRFGNNSFTLRSHTVRQSAMRSLGCKA